MPVKYNTALTAERAREVFEYSPETGELRWRSSGSIVGHHDGTGYIQLKIDGHLYQAHRVIWLMVHGHWPPAQIDHINRIKDDNRISNLREATCTQNQMNRPARSDNKLGLNGVSRKGGIYVAQINEAGKRKHIGCFPTPEEARAAYRKAARELYGEFAA